MDNILYSPDLNPVIFYDEDRAISDTFQTKHFDEFPFDERGQSWLQTYPFSRVWQTTDIIEMQFTASFDPIIVSLLNSDGEEVIVLPALIGLPNIYYPNTWIFEVSMSLAGLDTGCYRLKRTLGSGISEKIQYSDWMHISADPIPGTVLIKYWHSRFYKDVVFESGKQFSLRVFGWLDYDRQGRKLKQELYRDEQYNQTILNSKGAKNIPLYLGDEFGQPTDLCNILEQVFECDHVQIDDKFFTIADGAGIEYIDVEGYRMRGMNTIVEPGINRNSRITTLATNPNQQLMYGIMVSRKAFGDTGNQDSANTVPWTYVE